jgi:hypothetical protein
VRKSIISTPETGLKVSPAGSWFDLDTVARVELSSEDPKHPFEEALRVETPLGWKAAVPGPQVLVIHFDDATAVRRIRLQFREERLERSQEIALFATFANQSRKELARQQWVFSPGGATTELEDYFFDLKDVTSIELQIDPGRHDRQVYATLEAIQIG